MDIPIYLNSELTNITTPLRDETIPDKPMQAQLTLIIDDYEKAPSFYEEKLDKIFTVDVENGKKYYEMRFKKENGSTLLLWGTIPLRTNRCIRLRGGRSKGTII